MLAPFTAARPARGVALVERAVSRGELTAGVDLALALNLPAAPIYWRMVVIQGAADLDYLDRSTRALTAALRSC